MADFWLFLRRFYPPLFLQKNGRFLGFFIPVLPPSPLFFLVQRSGFYLSNWAEFFQFSHQRKKVNFWSKKRSILQSRKIPMLKKLALRVGLLGSRGPNFRNPKKGQIPSFFFVWRTPFKKKTVFFLFYALFPPFFFRSPFFFEGHLFFLRPSDLPEKVFDTLPLPGLTFVYLFFAKKNALSQFSFFAFFFSPLDPNKPT